MKNYVQHICFKHEELNCFVQKCAKYCQEYAKVHSILYKEYVQLCTAES